MVKKNKLKLIGSTVTTTKKILPKEAASSSTTLFSIVVSIIIIASISAIGISFAYMISHFSITPTTGLDIKSKCISSILGFEQKGYYSNAEQLKAALASCI
jgi:hypothetical protein